MNATKQQTLLLSVIVGALILQVLLSAALLIRINAVAQNVFAVQQMLARPPGPQSPAGIISDVSAEGAPSIGEPDAAVTIIVFSDFACSACAELWETLVNIRETYPSEVLLVHRDFPLNSNHSSLSMQAANAARCAGEHGHYWTMYDMLFANQDNLTVEDLSAYGAEIGLAEDFTECRQDIWYAEDIMSDQAAGIAAGVGSVPSVFINGRLSQGAMPFAAYKQIIEEELQKNNS